MQLFRLCGFLPGGAATCSEGFENCFLIVPRLLGCTAAAMLIKQARITFRKHVTKPSEQVATPPNTCHLFWPIESAVPYLCRRSIWYVFHLVFSWLVNHCISFTCKTWASSDLLSRLSERRKVIFPSFLPSILIVKDEKVTAERTDLGSFLRKFYGERGHTLGHGQTLATVSENITDRFYITLVFTVFSQPIIVELYRYVKKVEG